MTMKTMKRILSSGLAVIMMMTMLGTTAFATSANTAPNEGLSTEQATKADVLALKPYVEIDADGFLSIKGKEALENGAKEQAVEALLIHFDILNEEIKNGEITVNEDLTIIGGEKEMAVHYCNRGVNSYTEFWWGYQRMACNCESIRIANELSTLAAAGGMVAGGSAGATVALGVIFPPAVPIAALIGAAATFDGSYWALVSSRITANNAGRGTISNMTAILFFDIEPQ